tara:strand:- start:483 stop:677 length:195 start_codon:yes stop_codon:yes gene_type:complete
MGGAQLTNYDDALFANDPSEFVLELVDDGAVNARAMIVALMQGMTADQLRDALHAAELSPAFGA